tara:strand:- start:282 stop:641 length:360 start_codon:yes stop_codon:yes gene_type:complete
MSGIKFGVEPNMSEVPPGQTATIALANFSKWELKETDYGVKFCIPITLFSHPSYDSIPSKGMKCNWVSKSTASKALFDWVFEEGDPEQPKTFDFDLEKEFKKKWKLTRHETGGYSIEQL